MKEELKQTIILLDEDNNEVEFEFLDDLEFGGDEYIALTPADDEEGNVYFLKVVGEEGQEEYAGIEDETLLVELFELFRELNAEIYAFEEE